MVNELGYADRDDPHTVTLTHDEVLILQDFFEWLEETEGLKFRHPAEWTAVGRVMAQLLPPLWEVFDTRYKALLDDARSRYSQTFEGTVPGLGHVKVEEDGSVVPADNPDVPRS